MLRSVFEYCFEYWAATGVQKLFGVKCAAKGPTFWKGINLSNGAGREYCFTVLGMAFVVLMSVASTFRLIVLLDTTSNT